jgi:hypothetical protein
MALAGCGTTTVLSSRFRSDLPLPAPSPAPDSLRAGMLFGSVAVQGQPSKLDDFREGSTGGHPVADWSTSPWRVSGQAQLTTGETFRILGGFAWGGTQSMWLGGLKRWTLPDAILELEVLGGATYGSAYTTYSESCDPNLCTTDTLRDTTDTPRFWSQLAITGYARHGGLWGEFRVLPELQVASLPSSVSLNESTIAVGTGWWHPFSDHCMALLGGRLILTQNKAVPQAVVQFQVGTSRP